jgi:transposase
VLAFVAYRQPIARAGIELIRGSASAGALDTLLERGLIAHNPHQLFAVPRHMTRLRRIWADNAYRAWSAGYAASDAGGCRGSPVHPGAAASRCFKWRWIVERTFVGLKLSRRLSKDYEVMPASSEACIRLAMPSIMLRRLAR